MSEREAILRSLAWQATLGYPPTLSELRQHAEAVIGDDEVDELIASGEVVSDRGRLVLAGEEASIDELERRERFFPRKWQKILRLARLLRWVPTIRWMAVCNTTAVGYARDAADIDLMIITRSGTLWMTRLILAGMARLIGRRPGERESERDAWCFSFFVSDQALSLKRYALAPHDPYLEWWTLRLLPLIDDGIGEAFWREQAWVWQRRPKAAPWVSWGAIQDRGSRVGPLVRRVDAWCFKFLRRFGSKELLAKATEEGTDVVMEPEVAKLHLDDRRAWFREQYEHRCARLGIAPYADAR